MKTVLKISLVVGLLLQHLAHSEPSQRDISNRRISLYQADLVCPAAPQIGCGSAAKPILMGLESDQLVSEAWLSRAGTVVAVVWKQAGPAKEHARIIRSALREQQQVREIKGSAREQLLKSFRAGSGWYRAAAVDRLSEEEAGITATKLVRKMQTLVSIPEDKAKALQQAFTATLAHKLTRNNQQDPGETHLQILKICREHLEEKDIVVLQQAQEKGAFSHLREE